MKAEELRIGNYILESGIINRIEVIYSDKYGAIKYITPQGNEVQTHISFINPIPLTEEWLIKFGFIEFTGRHPSYDKEKLSICFPNGIHKEGRTYFNSWAILEHMPKYVHQIQNLYYALRGEELTITEV